MEQRPPKNTSSTRIMQRRGSKEVLFVKSQSKLRISQLFMLDRGQSSTEAPQNQLSWLKKKTILDLYNVNIKHFEAESGREDIYHKVATLCFNKPRRVGFH